MIYFPAGSYVFDVNVIVPPNIAIELRPGAVISFSAPTVQMVFNGDLIIDHSQTAFIVAPLPAAPQVVINSKNLDFVSPRWWGAKGDTRFSTALDNSLIAVGATTFTSTSLGLTPTDVGKTAAVFGAGPTPFVMIPAGGVTNSGTTITATVASTIGLVVGQQVVISGITGFATNNPNGTVTLTGVNLNSSQIIYTVASAPTGGPGIGGQVVATQTIPAGGVTNSGTTITATIASTAGLVVGQQAVVSGVTGFATNNPNGTVTVTGVNPALSQITYTVASAPTGGPGGGGMVTTTQNITAFTISITATVPSTAAIKVGQTVLIQGVTGFTSIIPNGLFKVVAVPSGTTFTFTANAAPIGTYTANSGSVAPATWWISTVTAVSSGLTPTATMFAPAGSSVPANTTYIRLGTDDGAAIQAAIAAAGGGTRIFLAPAIYTVKTSIELGGNEATTFEGVRPFTETNAFINDFTWANASGLALLGTWISYVGTGTCFSNAINFNTGLRMRDVGLLGTGLAGTTGVYLRQLDSGIDSLLICNFDTGVDVAGIIGVRWSDISCRGCNIGHSHGSVSSSAGFWNISTLIHLSASQCGVGLRLIQANTNVYIGLDVENCDESTVGGALGKVWLSDDGAGHGSVGNKFQTAWCEDVGGVNSFYIGPNCAGNTLRDIQIVYPWDSIHLAGPNNNLGSIRADGLSTGIVIDATATGTSLNNIASTITLSGAGVAAANVITATTVFLGTAANADTSITRLGGATGGVAQFDGTISVGHNSQGAIVNGNTIATSGGSPAIAYGQVIVTPASNVSGIILQAGLGAGVEVTVINESAFTVTFAAVATSHVADGTSDVIAANNSRRFQWSPSGLWYPSK
jgi:hypothetical protein